MDEPEVMDWSDVMNLSHVDMPEVVNMPQVMDLPEGVELPDVMDPDKADAVSLAERVPEEILEKMFSLLQRNDRLNARLVSKLWRCASYSYLLMQKEFIFIRNYRDFIAIYSPFSEFSAPFQPISLFLSITAEDIQSPEKTGEPFWVNNCRKLHELIIEIDSTHFKFLPQFLRNCPNLESLQLEITGDAAREKMHPQYFEGLDLPKLKILVIFGDKLLYPALVQVIIKKATVLQILQIKCSNGNCLGSFDHNPFGSFEHLNRLKGLVECELDCSSVDDYLVDKVTENFGSDLKSIVLPNCLQLTHKSSKMLQARCKNLQKLELGNLEISSNYITELLHKDSLIIVSIFCSKYVNNTTVIALCNIPMLSRLSISQCKVSDRGIISLLGSRNRPEMIELRLTGLKITDTSIKEISSKLQNLRILSLNNCRFITSESLSYVANNMKSLECLAIHECKRLDSGVFKPRYDLPVSLNEMINLVHLGANQLFAFPIACMKSLQLPRLKVFDCSLPETSRRLKQQCPSLILFNNICCLTHKAINDSHVLALRRSSLFCSRSPLGSCEVYGTIRKF